MLGSPGRRSVLGEASLACARRPGQRGACYVALALHGIPHSLVQPCAQTLQTFFFLLMTLSHKNGDFKLL